MACFEPCRRALRHALYLAASAIPLGALAQPRPCSELPPAQQAQAQKSGACVDAAAKQVIVLTPKAAAMAAAASSARGARLGLQCAPLPDFAARQATYEQAVQALPPGLYRPRVAKLSPSSAPARVVIAQSTEPLDGRLCRVSFVLSDGSLVRVPPVRGLTGALAAQRLQAAGLAMSARQQPSDAADDGRVFEQRPEASAEVARGSMVQVAIAQPATLTVPDAVDRQLGEARTLLSRFAVEARLKESVQPTGTVLTQLPPGESKARPGSTVVLAISDGSLVQMPDLVKQPLAQARELLDRAGLGIDTVDDTSGAPPGTVTTQQPTARTEARRGSVVTLHVSSGLTVPKVVGRSLGDAEATLRSFVVHEEKVASDHAKDEVLGQSPPAGTRVAARSRVTLGVSDGSIATVPPLHGATLADARVALQRAGDLNAVTPSGDEPGTRIVDISSPAAGIHVQRGSPVALTLVPLTPWRAWAAGTATLLLLGGAGLYKWRQRKSLPSAPQVAVQFSPSIEFNIRPIEARAGGPEAPAIGLCAELLPGRAWARPQGESK